MRFLFWLVFAFQVSSQAATLTQSGRCSDSKTDVLSQVHVPKFKDLEIANSDCVIFTSDLGLKTIVAIYVVNDPSEGVQSRVVLLQQAAKNKDLEATFVSEALAEYSFPMNFKGEERLILATTEKNQNDSLSFLLNLQTGPKSTSLAQWKLDLKTLHLVRDEKMVRTYSADRTPKILSIGKGQWKAHN